MLLVTVVEQQSTSMGPIQASYLVLFIIYTLIAALTTIPIFHSSLIFEKPGSEYRAESWFLFFGVFMMPFVFAGCGFWAWTYKVPILFAIPPLYVVIGIIILATCCSIF